MSRRFSFKPGLMLRGRKFKGLRGWAGKPLHPPLTDVPVSAYIFAAAFDVISLVAFEMDELDIARNFFIAGTYVIIGGAIVSLGAALTGFWDWLKSTSKGTQARRTANAHMATMLTVTALVIVDIIVRLATWDEAYAELPVVILSAVVALLVSIGASLGGELVYDFGFNVETAGDSVVWHESEEDVLPGAETYPAQKP